MSFTYVATYCPAFTSLNGKESSQINSFVSRSPCYVLQYPCKHPLIVSQVGHQGNNTEFALIIMYGLCFFASYRAPNNYKVVMKSHCISESLVM